MATDLHAAFAFILLIAVLATGIISIAIYRRRSPDLSGVRGSAMLGPGIRGWHYENLRPIEEFLVERQISPTLISSFQLVVSVVVGAAYAGGLMFAGGWLLLFAGSIDIVDGRVARRLERGSKRGAFLDSMIDRYADAIAYLGLAYFYAGSWMEWVVLASLVGSFMVSYARARAEGLGTTCLVGLFQRPERFVLLGLGSIFGSLVEHMSGWHLWGQPYGMIAAVLVLLAVLTNVTAIQRAVHVLGNLPGAEA